MKSMLAITKLLTRQKLRKLDILSDEFLSNKQSKFRELYDAMQDGKVRNDREASQLLYDADSTDPRYRQLKSRFKKRMLNTLFFVNQSRPHRSSFDQTYHNCQRDWSLVNILLANGASEPALDLSKSLLTCALKYGFSELIVQLARLHANDAAACGETKRLLQMEQLIDEHSALHALELESERVLRKLKQLRATQLPYLLPDDQMGQTLTELQSRLNALSQQSSSPLIRYDLAEGTCIVLALQHDWTSVLREVNAIVSFGESKHRQAMIAREQTLRELQMLAAANCQDAALARDVVRQHLGPSLRTGCDWLVVQRLRATVLLNSGRYALVHEVCKDVQTSRHYRDLGAPEREQWQLFSALALLLSTSDPRVQALQTTTDLSSFFSKEATIGGGQHRLNAWRMLVKAGLYRQQQDFENASAEIIKLRELAVRRLHSKRDASYIAVAQVLHRVERKEFSPYLDRVAERHQADLDQYLPALSTSCETFEPIHPGRILEVFGIRSLAVVV